MPSTVAHHHCGGLRLPLHTLLAAVAPESSPSGLFLHSQPRSCPQVGPLKPELQLPAPACTSGRVSQARERTAEALTTRAIRHPSPSPAAAGSALCSEEAPSVPVGLPAGEGASHGSLPGAQAPFRSFSPSFSFCPPWLCGFIALSAV